MKKKIVIGIVALGIIGAIAFLFARRDALRILGEERGRNFRVSADVRLREIGPLDRSLREGWRVVATGREIRDLALFEGKIWAATSGGLLSVSPDGSSKKLYTRLNGLPDADVTRLAIHDDKLFVGTSSGALLAVKNNRISLAKWENLEIGPITALLSTPEGLYVGSAEKGLFLYDGKRIGKVWDDVEAIKLHRVTSISAANGKLFVGTFENGIYAKGAAGYDHYTTEKGLQINNITAIAEYGGSVAVGTPLGLAIIAPDGSLKPSATAFVNSMVVDGASLLLGTEDGFLKIGANGEIESRIWLGARLSSLNNLGGVIYAGTDDGIYKVSAAVEKIFSPGETEIPGNHITALLPSENGVWLGTFDSGSVFLDGGLGVKTKLIDEPGWAVNAIKPIGDATYIAHNAGVSVVRDRIVNNRIGSANGLIGSRVSDVCAIKDGAIFATEAGVTIQSTGALASLYSFHGLANNHVYSCAVIGDDIYVGTLGGLSLIRNGKVAKSWRPGDSPLKTGWINALAVDGKDLYIGTYGGGVMRLGGDGSWTDFSNETGNIEVNPGAMLAIEGMILIGSLDAGLFVLNISTGKVKNISDGIASLNVSSIAYDGRFYYIGTDRGLTVIPAGDIRRAE